jgi:hypothetical protein
VIKFLKRLVKDAVPKKGNNTMSRNEMGERRQHKRFQTRDGAFAAPRAQDRKLWQILDISRGGLAFRYVDNGEELDGSSNLDILTRDTLFSLEGVPFQTISDVQIPEETFLGYGLRRRGVQFGELADSQTSQLEYFIRKHTQK